MKGRIVGVGLRFLMGGFVGGLVSGLALLLLHFMEQEVQLRRPAQLRPGEQVHVQSDLLRVFQTCRGACDEIKP